MSIVEIGGLQDWADVAEVWHRRAMGAALACEKLQSELASTIQALQRSEERELIALRRLDEVNAKLRDLEGT